MADRMVKREGRLPYARSGREMSLQDLMDMWLEDFFENPIMARIRPFEWRMQELGPIIDVLEQEDRILINAEVPGMGPEDIDISLSGDTITISGEKKAEREEEVRGRRYSERSYGSFCRAIPLPPDIDRNKVEARFRNGLLTLTVPKSQAAIQRARKIPIKSDFYEASAQQPADRQDIETMGAEEALEQMEEKGTTKKGK